MADIIQVLPDETIDGLIAKVTALATSGPSEPVLIWVPRGIAILHQMEDFQALNGIMRRQGVQIKILSPDARVVGLGKVFGVEAETTSHLPGTAAEDAARSAAPPAARDVPSTPPAPASARRPSTTPLPPAASPPAAPPAPLRRSATSPLPSPAAPPAPQGAPGVSETDWLLGDGGNLDALLNDSEHTGRSATPPPDVLLPGMAAPRSAPPVAPAVPPAAVPQAPAAETAETDWLTAGLDLEKLTAESLNPNARPAPPPADAAGPLPPAASTPADPFAGASVPPPDLPIPPAAPPAQSGTTDPFAASFEQVPPFYMDATPPAAPPPAPRADSFSLSDLLQATEEEGGGPPMSFADWLALQGSGSAARAGSPAPPPDVDLDNLPAWMRPEPPASKEAPVPPVPPAAPGLAGRKGILRCPHCGEELDKEEMLRMLAEVWGLDS